MSERIPILRTALRRERSKRRARQAIRYPGDLRRRVVALACSRRAEGDAMRTLASDLGLPLNTLRRWCSAVRTLERVEVVPSPSGASASGPVLVTPSGHRVEGLSLVDLAALLERLA